MMAGTKQEESKDIKDLTYALERAEELRDQARFQCNRYREQKLEIRDDLKAVAAQETYPPKLVEIVQTLLDKHFPEGFVD
jgi:hypothetical protein